MTAKIKFTDYVNMVRDRAHYYSKCYKMEYADIEAQGFLIYCMAIQNYHKKKASFSTYLYINLNGRLRDYCDRKKAKEGQESGFEDILKSDLIENINSDFLPARKHGITLKECLECANKYLSSDAYEIFSWLLSRQWEDRESVSLFTKALYLFSGVWKWNTERVHIAWAEIGDFWHSGLLERSLAQGD
jgi:DNA-directed RNA polymerase specialized sigma24 family protein